jgi:hypothetical protein
MAGVDSEYSYPTSFTTKIAFDATIILQPKITSPSLDSQTVNPNSPLVQGSPFTVIGTAVPHDSTDWQVANDPGFTDIIADSIADTVNKTLWTVPIELAAPAYLNVKYHGGGLESPVSSRRILRPRPTFTGNLGIAYKNIGGGMTTCRYVNADDTSESVSIASNYWTINPIFVHQETTIVGQEMVTFNPFWVKCIVNQDAEIGEDIYTFCLSPEAKDGYFLHPMFWESYANPVFLGKYLSGLPQKSGITQANSRGDYCIGSFADPRSSISATSAFTYANWLNTDTDSQHRGWHMQTIYERQGIYLLEQFKRRSMISNMEYNFFDEDTLQNTHAVGSEGLCDTLLNSKTNPAVLGELCVGAGYSDNGEVWVSLPGNVATLLNISSTIPAMAGDWDSDNASIGKIWAGGMDMLGFDVSILFIAANYGTETGVSIRRCTGAPIYMHMIDCMLANPLATNGKIWGTFNNQDGMRVWGRIAKY